MAVTCLPSIRRQPPAHIQASASYTYDVDLVDVTSHLLSDLADKLRPSDAYNKEQEILAKYKKYKYSKTTPLNSGNTELFSTNLLTLKEREREVTSIWEL